MKAAAEVIDALRAENENLQKDAMIWEYFEPQITPLLDFGQSERGTKILGTRAGDSIFKAIDSFLRSLPVLSSTDPQ